MVGIRADANDIVASGHIMRCITIAKQIQKLGESVVFFLADDFAVPILTDNHIPYVILHTDWQNPLEEIPILCEEINKRTITAILFDSYSMTKEYFMLLRERILSNICFAYIDDLFEDIYPVDIIINYNAYYTQFSYDTAYEKETILCLGPEFVPLREEFSKGVLKEEQANNVLLSCGGGDILQTMYGILSAAVLDRRLENVHFHVVVGRFHKEREKLENFAAEYKNITLHNNVTNMAELMGVCKIAVSAAGTMLYELCAMQRPTIFFVTADNQRYDSDFFAMENRMKFAGDIRVNRECCIKQILDGICDLIENKAQYNEMQDKLRKITDGKGALRIAQKLLNK